MFVLDSFGDFWREFVSYFHSYLLLFCSVRRPRPLLLGLLLFFFKSMVFQVVVQYLLHIVVYMALDLRVVHFVLYSCPLVTFSKFMDFGGGWMAAAGSWVLGLS